jgi:hypothetical protein
MRHMTWDELHDFALVGASLALLAVLAVFYPTTGTVLFRMRVNLMVVAFIMAVYLLALLI